MNDATEILNVHICSHIRSEKPYATAHLTDINTHMFALASKGHSSPQQERTALRCGVYYDLLNMRRPVLSEASALLSTHRDEPAEDPAQR